MSGIRIVTSTFLALAVAIANPAAVAADEVDATIRAELEHVAQRRIFFGHQSVGENLLEGIKQLSATAGVPIHVVETPTAGGVPPATRQAGPGDRARSRLLGDDREGGYSR